MRLLSKILPVVLLLHVSLILYANRALFFSKFDEPYWKDKYEHSQWKLPLSVRTVGDDGLYLYEGYRLITGGDPTLLNAEVPPLGKYLIGLSILLFGNGHWYGFIVNSLVLITLFVLSNALLKNTAGALLVTSLVALDPLITSQFPLTMLDSLQLLFLLLTFTLLLHKRFILAAIAFGLFSETKFPILGPPVAILVGLYIWRTTKSWKSLVVFFTVSAGAYLIPYIHYFALGHNVLDWLRVQKWIASFYINSNLTPNVGSSIFALLSGWYQNLFTRGWTRVPEWSPLWTIITPLAFISSITTLWKIYKGKEKIVWLPIAGFAFFSLLFFAIIPFWTRYLVLLLPFFYLMAIRHMLPHKKITILVMILLFINLLFTFGIHFPTPNRMLSQFSYNWQYGFFHDIYEDLSTSSKTQSREEFRRLGQRFFAQAEIESVTIALDTTTLSRFDFSQDIPAQITYFTRHLGSFTENSTIRVLKENGQWRIPWEWNWLIDDLTENRHMETLVSEARRGSILASDKTKLAQDAQSVMIWVTPNQLDSSKEEALLQFLLNLFDQNIDHIAFHQRYVGNSQPDIPIPMGAIYKPLTDELKEQLFSFPGLSLTPHLARIYGKSNIVTIGEVENRSYFECCSRLYTTTTYDGIDGIEKERNSELKGYNGGSLLIKDEQGNIVRSILNLNKIDGKDVQL